MRWGLGKVSSGLTRAFLKRDKVPTVSSTRSRNSPHIPLPAPFHYSIGSQSVVCGPAARSPGNMLAMYILQLHPRPTESETLGV